MRCSPSDLGPHQSIHCIRQGHSILHPFSYNSLQVSVNNMNTPPERKISRTVIALGSTALLVAAATLGFYNSSVSFDTLLDRNMLHQCNGPQRGIKLTPGRSNFIAAMPPGNARLFYIPTPVAKLDSFCQCEVNCAIGRFDLYMTDWEGFWTYPNFLNNWQPEEEYECVSKTGGNSKETCEIRGVGDEWFAYIMIRAKTPATRCTIICDYIII